MQQTKKLVNQKGEKSNSRVKLKKGKGWFGDTAGHSEAATMLWTYRKFMTE